MKYNKKHTVGKKTIFLALALLIGINLFADKRLDALEAKSQDFFKAVTGLEHDYIKVQMNKLKQTSANNRSPVQQRKKDSDAKTLSKDEYSKNAFTYENELARIKKDFTRTTTLIHLKIGSMYSFNGKDYVVMYLDDSKISQGKKEDEMTLNIDGRYKTGDYILSHKIIAINTQTKMVKLSKIVDDEYWYAIYINNNGVFVSDLKKRANNENNTFQTTMHSKRESPSVGEKLIETMPKKSISKIDVSNKECRYVVNISGLNVRSNHDLNAPILDLLRNQDEFTMKQQVEDWFEIDTMYKQDTGEVIVVKDEPYWINNYNNNITSDCMIN